MQTFKNREAAGKELAQQLMYLEKTPNLIVLALPRGGVPVAVEIAKALKAPLDLVMIRKLGYPSNPEYAMGAIGIDKKPILNSPMPPVNPEELQAVIEQEYAELLRRNERYRNGNPPPDVKDKTIIIVDDGIATGATLKAALRSIRAHNPVKIIVAVPVAPYDSLDDIKNYCDAIICPLKPHDFRAVGLWYDNFRQVSDEEVIETLQNQPYPDE